MVRPSVASSAHTRNPSYSSTTSSFSSQTPSSGCRSSFLQSPSHVRSGSVSSAIDSQPSCPYSALKKRSSYTANSHYRTASNISTTTPVDPVSGPVIAPSANQRSSSSTPPVYEHKRTSHRYSASPASSYTAYSSALAASYQQHQQLQQQLHLHHQHTRSLGHSVQTSHHTQTIYPDPINSTQRGLSCRRNSGSNTSVDFVSHSYNSNGNMLKSDDPSCNCVNSMAGSVDIGSESASHGRSNHRFNAPPSPCLSALDSSCRPDLISRDSSTSAVSASTSMSDSALPSPSLSSVSSTDSIFSGAGGNIHHTSMAHCSPILPNAAISALLLHGLPPCTSCAESSSTTSSPALSHCSSPRMPSSSVSSSMSSSPSSSPSPSPPPAEAGPASAEKNIVTGRTRRTSSMGSRMSQASGTSCGSGYFNHHGSGAAHLPYALSESPSCHSSSSTTSAAVKWTKRRSHSSSPLSRPSSTDSGSQASKSRALRAGTGAVASMNSPQVVAQLSTRYIRFLLLPLIPLLFLALGAQTSTNFETPAKYTV